MASPPNTTNITPPRVPVIDSKTGLISREWYRFLLNLYTITGAGTGVTPIVNGGTNSSATPVAGGVAYGNGTAYRFTPAGTAGLVLTSNGTGAPSWTSAGAGTVSSVDVSGGATGLTTSGGPVTSSGTITLAGVLGTANGGTNSSATPTAGAVPYGTGTAYGFTAVGTAGQVLTSSGAGAPTWTSAGAGTVTSVDVSGGTTGLTVSGGPVTSSGVLTLAGTLAIANGGTGQTTANAALNAFLPSQASNSGKYLTTNGTDTSWATVSSAGTVTSVAQTFTGGLISVAGSPITSAGTLALTVAGTSGGIPYFSSATDWASSATLAANAIVVGGGAGAAPATITTGTGVTTALGVNTGTAGAFVVNGGALGTPTSGTVTNLTGTASININGTVGATTASTGAFTTLSATSTVSGTGFNTFLASPPAIGGTTPAAGTFTTVTGRLTPTAGTATAGTAPLKFATGTNLTTPEIGTVEFNGATYFSTEDTTSGRGFIPSQKFYRQIADGTTTTAATIADFFPATSSIALSATSLYEIECWCYFRKTTAGTVTFTMAASSAPTWMNGSYVSSPITGINATGATPTGSAGSTGALTAAWAATGSLTTAVNHSFRFTIRILTNAATNWRMRFTSNTGTTQSLIGSYYIVRELPAASTGVFVA